MSSTAPNFRVHVGRVEDVAPTLEGPFDAVLCDPPYGLEFMGKAWDRGVPPAEVWREVAQLLRPGAHAAAFGGTRTYHLLASALEGAGLEIRDCLSWLYGSGFPKSLSVEKALDRARTEDRDPIRRVCRFVRAAMDRAGIKSSDIAPAFECNPRLVDHWAARDTDSQPSLPTLAQWATLRGLETLSLGPEMDAEVERLNGRKGQPGENWWNREKIGQHNGATPGIGGSRFAAPLSSAAGVTAPATEAARHWDGYGTALKPAWEPCVLAMKPLDGTFAANALEHGVAGLNVDGGRIGDSGGTRSEDQGKARSEGFGMGGCSPIDAGAGRWPANVALDEEAAAMLDEQSGELTSGANPTRRSSPKFGEAYGDFDGARECRAARGADTGGASRFFYVAKVATAERNAGLEPGDPCRHPTLKPVRLMEWLAKLLLPPPREDGKPRRLLVPFSGAGSEVAGALRAGWDEVVGIEQSPEYSAWAERRVPALVRLDFEASRSSSPADLPGQGLLFDEGAA